VSRVLLVLAGLSGLLAGCYDAFCGPFGVESVVTETNRKEIDGAEVSVDGGALTLDIVYEGASGGTFRARYSGVWAADTDDTALP
jgi:hypothetical protein